MMTGPNKPSLPINQSMQIITPSVSPNISAPFPLSGATKTALILKALRAGIEAASGDLQTLYQAAGRQDATDVKQLASVIHALVKEFTDSLAAPVAKKIDRTSQWEKSHKPTRHDHSQSKYKPSAEALARDLQCEHSGVVAVALGGKNTKFAVRVLRSIDASKAQRAILHFTSIEDAHETSHKKAAKIIRLRLHDR